MFILLQCNVILKQIFLQWDDKITTLPGLYFISIGILTPAARAYSAYYDNNSSSSTRENGEREEPLLCTTLHLRAINLVLSAVTMLILNKLVQQIHGNKHVRNIF